MSRRDYKMTQGELSERSGVSRSYIAQVERGDVTNIGVEPLMALAKALDVSVAYLVGETDVATKEDEDELTLAESRNVYSVDPATRELLELIEGMDGSQRQQLIGIARVLSGAPRVIGGGRD